MFVVVAVGSAAGGSVAVGAAGVAGRGSCSSVAVGAAGVGAKWSVRLNAIVYLPHGPASRPRRPADKGWPPVCDAEAVLPAGGGSCGPRSGVATLKAS